MLAFCFVVGSGFEFCYNCCSAASTFVALIIVAAAILVHVLPVVVLVTALFAAVVHVLAVVQNGLVSLAVATAVVATSKWCVIHLPVRSIIQCFLRSMSQHILFSISPCPPPPRPARHRPARGSRTGWSGSPRTCGSEEG